MAYVEVWKEGKLITRRQVSEEKARKGCRIQLGSAGQVRVKIGETKQVGKFEVRIFAGDIPEAKQATGGIDSDLSEPGSAKVTSTASTFSETTMAGDIDNYLNGKPLLARSPTTIYLLRKKVSKYRRHISITAAVLVVFVGIVLFAYLRGVETGTKAKIAQKGPEIQQKAAELESQTPGKNDKKAPVAIKPLKAENARPTPEMLYGRRFRFSRRVGKDSGIIGIATLNSDGTIGGHRNDNETFWLIDEEGRLVFKHRDGRVSSIFTHVNQRDGKWFFSGPFQFNQAVEHLLEEVGSETISGPPAKNANQLRPEPGSVEEKIEAAAPEKATVKPAKARKILVFCLCKGFYHESIPVANKAIEIMGKKTGAYNVVISDDMNMFDAKKLAEFDAILFNNTTKLDFNGPGQRQALMDFVKGGKGIIGLHAAMGSFDNWPEATEMMGGQYAGYPWTANGVWAINNYEPNHPLNAAFKGEGFNVRDEIYSQKKLSPVENRRILLTLDFNDPATKNAKGAMESDRDTPVSWIKDYGRGRIFFCELGHNNEIYYCPAILQHELDGIQFALGDLKVDARSESAAAPVSPDDLKRGLVLHFNFDSEPAAGIIPDLSGQGNNGKDVNVQWIADGHRGGSVQFGLTKSYITVSNNASLNPPQLTMSAWIKTSYKDWVWRRIFDKGTGQGYVLSMCGDDKGKSFQGEVAIEPGKTWALSGIKVTDGRWRHVVGTFDGTYAKIYVDGRPAGKQRRWEGKIPYTAYDLTIGANRSNPDPNSGEVDASFNGMMDDVMMFNRALSAEEVRTLFDLQKRAEDGVKLVPDGNAIQTGQPAK